MRFLHPSWGWGFNLGRTSVIVFETRRSVNPSKLSDQFTRCRERGRVFLRAFLAVVISRNYARWTAGDVGTSYPAYDDTMIKYYTTKSV